MILTVSGWRRWPDPEFIRDNFRRYLYFYTDRLYVRVGCAKGVDDVIRKACAGLRLGYVVYRADWDNLGKAAGPVRNGLMLRGQGNPEDHHRGVLTDKLLAFPQPGIDWRKDGSGTVGCIFDAISLRISLDIPGYRGDMEERK